jgi:flagellar hook-basal body complex protein FliE
MDITIGSLEMARTNPLHIGNSPIMDSLKLLYSGESLGTKSSVSSEIHHGSFESFVSEAMTALNDQQNAVTALGKQVLTDPDSVDVHDVTTAMAKAQMSLNLAQTVIDRLVSGWNELSQNR